MKFRDELHQKSYAEFIHKANITDEDVERKSLFYLLSMFEETKKYIKTLYDFKKNSIVPEGINAAWQTSGTRACTKLAFNLYNSFTGFEDDEEIHYSVINIFAYAGSDTNRKIFIEAIRIRFEMSNNEDSFFDPEESIESKLTRMGFKKI